jgi:acyl carrier protein
MTRPSQARKVSPASGSFQPGNHMEIPQKLKDYINENRAPLPPVTDPEEPLQIDSLGLIRLVAFMESDCGIRVEDDELVAENFATLRSLGDLIAQKSRDAETSS